eukprot:7263597-Alexandrium_andersonii.AAC.1
MSASLVGSEMCIRDRRWLRCLGRRVDPCPSVLHAEVGAACLACLALESVSYTHLTLPTICSV